MQTPSAFSPEELEEVCDLDMGQKQHILAIYHLLGKVTYYSLLGVDPHADKKDVKKAYYDLAATVHPDKFFRKNLGTFRKKMEDVFARLTEAMEILTHPDKRKEYDDYLKAHGFIISAPPPPRRSEPSQANIRAPAPSVPKIQSRPPVEVLPPTAEDIAARKRALAAKLLGKRPSTSQPVAQEVEPAPVDTAGNAVASLRARYEEGLRKAKEKGASKYIDDANAFCAKDDFISALSSLEHGVRANPDSDLIKARLTEVKELAAPQLFSRYAKQAKEMDDAGRAAEGARFWARAAELRPDDHEANFKAANGAYKAGDMKPAAEFAKHAVQHQPKSARYRVLLANIYHAAGLKASAKKEAEEAKTLAPKDPDVIALLKRLK